MRIVDRKAFLAMPAGTIFCKGEPWHFESICIKDDSLENDWFYLNPAWPASHDLGEAVDLLETSKLSGTSFEMEDAIARDGCFGENDVFLIFEEGDLKTLRTYIDRALALQRR